MDKVLKLDKGSVFSMNTIPSNSKDTTQIVLQRTTIKPGKMSKKMHVIGEVKELPEMIYVQTCFITEALAKAKKITAQSLLPIPTQRPLLLPTMQPRQEPPPPALIPYQNLPEVHLSAVPTIPISFPQTRVFISLGVQTDDIPQQDQCQQTQLVDTSRSIGIQCELLRTDAAPNTMHETETVENVLDDSEADQGATATELPTAEDEFVGFVTKHSHCYGNDRYECLKCGEIALNMNTLRAHMRIHCPVTLCFQCGLQYSKAEAKHHQCNISDQVKTKQPKRLRARYRCPHYNCPVRALSKLELYDHINEHLQNRIYECAACKRRFTTAIEFRKHRTVRPQCMQTSKKCIFPFRLRVATARLCRMRVFEVRSLRRGRVLVKSYLSKRSDARRSLTCTICLKKCSNTFQHCHHAKRCRKSYISRWQKQYENWKPDDEPQNASAN